MLLESQFSQKMPVAKHSEHKKKKKKKRCGKKIRKLGIIGKKYLEIRSRG